MKTICFVVDELSNGGSERVVSILANNLDTYGFKVNIIMLHGDRVDYDINEKIVLKVNSIKEKSKIRTLIKTISFLVSAIRELNPDIVISFDVYNNIYTIFSTFFLKNKVIVSERNDPNQYPQNKKIRNIRNFVYRFADRIIFQTNDALEYFNKNIQKKGALIPNPITKNLPYWKGELSEKTIITACRLTKQKNIPMLIDAFKVVSLQYPEYTLKIFGRGPLESELSEYIIQNELKEKVKLMGYTEEIHEEMSKASLFVISSNYEGMSNSMLEALAIGVPVISTDAPIGGAKMFINNNENGILINVEDTDALINSIKNILSDKMLAQSLSSKAKKIRNVLDGEQITLKWIDVVNEISSKNAGKINKRKGI